MLVAQGLDQTIFPQFARLAANLAGMEELLLGGKDVLANGVIPTVHMDTQSEPFTDGESPLYVRDVAFAGVAVGRDDIVRSAF